MFHSLQLHNFRSYATHAVEFENGVNIIVGPNGSGKTNLLEALFVLSTGGSFRVADRDLIKHGEDWFRLEGQYNGQQRVLTCRVSDPGLEKQSVIDGAKKARLTHSQRVPIVLFEPDYLRLLRESPSHRREYLDSLLIKTQPDFAWLKHQFERTLLQRNNVLKRRLPPAQRDDQLFVWDIKFADLSAQIVKSRQELMGMFQAQLAEVYSTIAHQNYSVQIDYKSSLMADKNIDLLLDSTTYKTQLLKMLQTNVIKDQERGFTTIGPHRDDFAISLSDAPASLAASRGEIRSLLLALKIIELRLLASQNDAIPLLLLDDVFSELDSKRRQALAELAKTYQTLITTTDADSIVEHFLDGYKIIATER